MELDGRWLKLNSRKGEKMSGSRGEKADDGAWVKVGTQRGLAKASCMRGGITLFLYG